MTVSEVYHARHAHAPLPLPTRVRVHPVTRQDFCRAAGISTDTTRSMGLEWIDDETVPIGALRFEP